MKISSKHVKNVSATIFFEFDIHAQQNKVLLTPTKTTDESKSQLSRPD